MLTITDKEFEKLSNYIRKNYGIYLREEKRSLLIGRLNNVLTKGNFESFSDYYDYVVSDKTGEAVTTLLDRVTTNHTFFMREASHFYFFRDNVVPYLASTIKDRDLRVWSAGCSTGEEPYVLAMILRDYFDKEKDPWDTKILATDISNKALGIAREGVYFNKDLEDVPAIWRLNYFDRLDNDKSAVKQRIKDEVIFRRFNLMDENFPFQKKFHVIFCRNVMIYFDEETKYRLISKFYDLLERGGYLFIGHSESLSRERTRFEYVMPAAYRKK